VLMRTFVAAVAVALYGCASGPITQTPFQRAASDAASIMSAAAYTVQFVHDDPARLTVAYAQGAVVNYLDQVATTPEELPTLEGAPEQATVEALVDHLTQAIDDLENVCLVPECDWQGQVERMTAASEALAEAAQ
jgi:hypothetical protein